MELTLVFPHQLFEYSSALKKNRGVLLIEDPRFFSDFLFHKQKLIFHRASMKSYEKKLKKKGYTTHYIEEGLESRLKQMKPTTVFVTEIDDSLLEKRLKSLLKKLKIKLEVSPTPSFISNIDDFKKLFENEKHFNFQRFYIAQRKSLNLLLDAKGKPIGGKWSLDLENRKKAPKNLKIPPYPKFPKTKEISEAITYVERNYRTHPGTSDSFNYPTTHTTAKKALRHFLQKRLHLFGDYEDAIVQKEQILFHSCLSPLLNTGLLTPNQVIEETIHFSKEYKIPLNSLEGFIRQIVGWREFIRGVYHLAGQKQRNENFFNHKRKMPKCFYEGTSGIEPIDETIKKLQKHAYVHHIERLMILGNFFLLCEISPNEIYKWFMELFIDAYDWVMVPNIFGMSQYADGGLMTTKPYFSSANYILKMSDYRKDKWSEIWDALFWRFMIKHLKFFQKQPRLSILCKQAINKKNDHEMLHLAEAFLKGLK